MVELEVEFTPKVFKGMAVKGTSVAWAAVVHLNFRAGSTFLIPVCTVPSSMDS